MKGGQVKSLAFDRRGTFLGDQVKIQTPKIRIINPPPLGIDSGLPLSMVVALSINSKERLIIYRQPEEVPA